MSNTLVFDYAVSISEAQTATLVDYGFLKRALVLVSGKYTAPAGEEPPVAKTAKKTKAAEEADKPGKFSLERLDTIKVPVKQKETTAKTKSAKSAKPATREFVDPTQFKVVPIYDPATISKYTDNTEVPFFMAGGLVKVYLLILASEVDPADEDVIDFDPTDYFTLCFSEDVILEDAQNIDFVGFDGVKAYATSDKSKADVLASEQTAFLDANNSYAGCYEQFGRFLSLPYWRNCQYYVLSDANPTTTIKTVGEADDLFDKRISFFLNGSDGPTLGFFGNANAAITKKYVDRLIRLETQQAITAYIQRNNPNNTAVQRVNIEEAASEVITKYEGFPYFYLDPEANNYITIVKSGELYIVGGKAELKDAEPIWRAEIEVTEAQ